MPHHRLTTRLSAAVSVALVPLLVGATTSTPVGGTAHVPAAEATENADTANLDQLSLDTTLVASGLSRPTAIAAPDDGSGRLFITEKPGTVRSYHPDTGLSSSALLDIVDRVNGAGNERGLLGIATAPDFTTNPQVYVSYTSQPDGDVTLSRFTLDTAAERAIDPASEEVLLTEEHPTYNNHNGGEVAFGPDGHLYWSLGDGGGSGDPDNNATDLGTLLGKIVRIDVGPDCAAAGYCVPEDNPFVDNAEAKPEIWSYGLRNAWRFSFDHVDETLWIADVGQGAYEEINHVPADLAGAHFGWSCLEGPATFDESRCEEDIDYVDPVFWYRTSLDGCAIIGGHVYRGELYEDIAAGTYVTADYCSATAWGVVPGEDGYESAVIGETPIQVTTFGTDADGELYLVNDLPGQLYSVSFSTSG
ncbi:PQQ-dependent sugar dehydrogenase [Actinoalloteichus caeruleus]|uniref:PQQ-dependent sugar dehydrogenase n=1 Tax=Actinoalloteichus cyanogriseus TaxID=2893586 RepID=UPI00068EE238|nr:PQQ-dependent sugar dehydrogenase [Actinoalloteichus caeruleus]